MLSTRNNVEYLYSNFNISNIDFSNLSNEKIGNNFNLIYNGLYYLNKYINLFYFPSCSIKFNNSKQYNGLWKDNIITLNKSFELDVFYHEYGHHIFNIIKENNKQNFNKLIDILLNTNTIKDYVSKSNYYIGFYNKNNKKKEAKLLKRNLKYWISEEELFSRIFCDYIIFNNSIMIEDEIQSLICNKKQYLFKQNLINSSNSYIYLGLSFSIEEVKNINPILKLILK